YRKAAERGFASAQTNLGVMYNSGEGVARDYAEAAKWHQRAAAQGLPLGQFNLATMYYFGDGVAKDLVQAYKWSALAAASFPPGQDRENAAHNRDIFAKEMSQAQLAEAQRLMREWKAKPELRYETINIRYCNERDPQSSCDTLVPIAVPVPLKN